MVLAYLFIWLYLLDSSQSNAQFTTPMPVIPTPSVTQIAYNPKLACFWRPRDFATANPKFELPNTVDIVVSLPITKSDFMDNWQPKYKQASPLPISRN